jgi:hypothetical protein
MTDVLGGRRQVDLLEQDDRGRVTEIVRPDLPQAPDT